MSAKQPPASALENVACYQCGSNMTRPLVVGQDDLTGKPGRFQFVTCVYCGLSFQQPR